MTASKIPSHEGPLEDILEFAMEYNAYERWANTREDLHSLLEPILREWRDTGRIPRWAGLDARRALLFYVFRSHYFGFASEEDIREAMKAVASKTRALARKSAAKNA